MTTNDHSSTCTTCKQLKQEITVLQTVALEWQDRCQNFLNSTPTETFIDWLEARLPGTALPYLGLLRAIHAKEQTQALRSPSEILLN